MKRVLLIGLIILIVIIAGITNVNAQDVSATAEFKANTTSVNPGGSFKVTLSAKSENGLNGIDTTYTYDTDKLELVNANVANNKWASLGEGNSITAICNTTDKVTTSDIYVLEFKVKDNVSAGTTAKINTTTIMIDTDAEKDSEVNIEAKSVEVSIAAKSENPGTNTPGTEQPGSDNTGKDETDTQKPETNKPNTSDKGNTGTSTDKKGVSVTESPKESGVTTKGSLPKTGTNLIILSATIIVAIVGIISLVLYKRYRKV